MLRMEAGRLPAGESVGATNHAPTGRLPAGESVGATKARGCGAGNVAKLFSF